MRSENEAGLLAAALGIALSGCAAVYIALASQSCAGCAMADTSPMRPVKVKVEHVNGSPKTPNERVLETFYMFDRTVPQPKYNFASARMNT